MNRALSLQLLCLAGVLLCVACRPLTTPEAGSAAPDEGQAEEQALRLKDALPGKEAIPGWTPGDQVQIYDSESLYDLVNGQADAFFAYRFEQVGVLSYENSDGATLRAEVWQLASPSDAYGLFTTYRAGTPASFGNEGDGDPGRRLDFWQERYFVRLFAPQPLPDADLQAFAGAIAAALPEGGTQPALMDRLPQDGLLDRDTIFFHEEISIQDYLWLGGENPLGLGPGTDGVLAQYQIGDDIATLLLVQYPDAGAAASGLESLEAAGVDNLVAAEAKADLLGAVFGGLSETQAGEMLEAALGNRSG